MDRIKINATLTLHFVHKALGNFGNNISLNLRSNHHDTNGDNRTSLWRSRALGDGQTLTLSWDTPQQTEEIRLIFDSDLSCELAITLSSKKQARQLPTPPPSLVRDYVLTLWRDGNRVAEAVVHDSAQRLAIHRLSGLADRLTLRIGRTWGADFASVFGVSVYGKGQKE